MVLNSARRTSVSVSCPLSSALLGVQAVAPPQPPPRTRPSDVLSSTGLDWLATGTEQLLRVQHLSIGRGVKYLALCPVRQATGSAEPR